MEKVLRKLNGNAPGITLLVLLLSLIGTGAGWAYQLRVNTNEIEVLKRDYVRRDVADAQYKSLADQLVRMSEDNKEAHREIFNLLREHK